MVNPREDRSRSPAHSPRPSHNRIRSRSPSRKHSRHHHAHHRSKPKRAEPAVLPLKAAKLSKHDLGLYKPLFASYLDIQKQIYIEDLPADEVKGRWKSFVRKWNYGELAEGWYDPETKRKALESAAYDEAETRRTTALPHDASPTHRNADEDGSSEDEYGPRMPSSSARHGAAAPGFQDLVLRDELNADDARASRSDLRYARKADLKEQAARIDELAPRAEPGTRERQLEKRREAAASNRAFAEARGEAVEEVRDADLLGGGDDDVKARKREGERKKNEREIRKEEILRARAAEREERLRGMREKEDETMALLKAIAQERFGGGGGGG